MAEVAIAVLTTAAVFLLVGTPLALAVRLRSEGWIPLLIDALLFGLVASTLSIALATWLGVAGIVLAALVWLGFTWLGIRRIREAGWPPRVRPGIAIVIAWVIVGIVTVFFRLQNDNFLPWVGDMGAYVSWADQFVRTGVLSATWPPVFPVYLAMSAAPFGIENVGATLPLTGIVLVLAVARLLRQLGVNRWIVVTAAGAVALNLHAIWFSEFPASESLSAPLFVVWLSLLVTAIRSRTPQLVAVYGMSFIMMIELSLLRGSGTFMLAPVVLLAVLTAVLPAWRRLAERSWGFLIANVAGFAVAYWYGVTEIPGYFVETQIRSILGNTIFGILTASRLVAPGPILVIALLVATGIPFLVWRLWVRRLVPGEKGSRVAGILGLIAGAALLLGVTADLAVHANVGAILARMGLWLVVLGAAGIILGTRKRPVDVLTAVITVTASLTLLLIVLQTPRLGLDRAHAFYLYWDRYLFSEVFPALVVLSGVGASLLLAVIAERRPRWRETFARRNGLLAAGAAIVAIALSASYSIPQHVLVKQHTYLEGSFAFTTSLKAQIPAAATARQPTVLWGATDSGFAHGWFFPNTWMAFAIPLERSFGVHIANVNRGNPNFGPDEVLTAGRLASFATCVPGQPMIVFETQVDAPSLEKRVSTAGITITPLRTLTSNLQVLMQPPTNGGWQQARIPVRVYRVAVDPTLSVGRTCPPSSNRANLPAAQRG
ncbi:MAG: hypothetical protein QOI02_870 [Actinomycetota bacterium]|nr:hypothetical protein [Actinomycetota bacterium]